MVEKLAICQSFSLLTIFPPNSPMKSTMNLSKFHAWLIRQNFSQSVCDLMQSLL